MENSVKEKIILTLIRHGSTRLNDEKKYIGWTDEALSEKGIKEIEEKKNIYGKYDLIFASPMLRCKETADILFPNQTVKVINEWKEINFGQFEGKDYKELADNPSYKAWVDSRCRCEIPDGEMLYSFINRSLIGLEKCLGICELYMVKHNLFAGSEFEKNYPLVKEEKASSKELKAAAVVHGGTIMAVLSNLTDKDFFDFQVKNGEGYILEFIEGKLQAIQREK